MTSVNVTENKYSVSVTEGATTVVTVKAPGPQGVQGATGATGAGISAGDKGALTVAANLTDWTLNDSVVTNAKVSASAAIAGTKISPDFGSQNITTTGNAVFGGNLTVSGTTTTIDSTTLTVEDKNIELGKVGSPTDITADGGGITLLGDTNHTFNWINATDSWTSSEHISLPDNKKLQLGDSQDLQLFHDSNHSNIKNITGNFSILSDTILLKNAANSESFIRCQNNGVQLYHSNSLKLGTYSGGLNLTGKLNVTGDIDIPDNSKLLIGTDDDLAISHDGTDSKITNITGNLVFEAKASETGIKVIPDGSVELYHNNVKQCETSSVGLDFAVDKKIRMNSNLTIYRDNNHGYIDHAVGALKIRSDILRINDLTNDHSMIHADADGAVKLYFNNVKKAETSADGFDLPDNSKLQLGDSQDVQVYWDGSAGFVTNQGGGNLHFNSDTVLIKNAANTKSYIRAYNNSSVELYHNNVKKAETVSYGFDVSGVVQGETAIQCNTNATGGLAKTTHGLIHGAQKQAIFQFNGVDDKIYLINNTTDKEFALLANSSGDTGWKVIPDGAVELYHDNVKRFNTTADAVDVHGHLNLGANTDDKRLRFGINNDLQLYHDATDSHILNSTGILNINSTSGIKVHGSVEPEADNTRALGSSSKRFTTLHSAALNTGDINMSNLNDNGNEVDGSKGSWTLQEGADDLFIINRVSGKKYKFNLTEIS